jgi:excinuclease ABC A subunit
MNNIVIKNAREHNLKNIDITIPRNKLVCFVGVSGSGKSTIAFDIIAREGQRQYFESLNSYARRYLPKSNKPEVDEIKGISSTVIISQDRIRGNPRSTVGTITEIYTYLRMLYSRVGLPSMDSSYYSFNHPYGSCPACKGLGRKISPDFNKLVDMNLSLNEGAILHRNVKPGTMYWNIIRSTDFFDMDRKLKDYSDEKLELLKSSPPVRFKDSEATFGYTFEGLINWIERRNSKSVRDMSETDKDFYTIKACDECNGWRLNEKSLSVKLNEKNIGQVGNMPITESIEFIKSIKHKNAEVIKPRLLEQMQNLINVGVGYLSLNRSADTLSGGEAQRVKLARQMSCDLIETIYVLDEPTAGLHPRDIDMVVKNLKRLNANNNTVLVVEHDETVMRSADYIIEIGPGAGKFGGNIVAMGDINEIIKNKDSVTGKYLREKETEKQIQTHPALPCQGGIQNVAIPLTRGTKGVLPIRNATRNNLKNVNVDIPLGMLVALTGVSGAGKSSLVDEIVYQYSTVGNGRDRSLPGVKSLQLIDQSPIGRMSRACIATYVGAFDEIRKIFSQETHMSASLFSFNSHGGCIECKGAGFIEMDMNFLGDVKIICENCHGNKYKEKVLQYKFKDKNIVDVLKMTAIEAKEFFDNKYIDERMDILIEVGLDYVELGQTLDTLSGGEAQRLKIASRLNNKGEFLIFDEPTTGLHFADIEKLMKLLNRLVDNGNTVLVIEHNLTVISQADWIIDMGPEGGDKGGEVLVEGRVEDVVKCERSWTGRYLGQFRI